MLTPRLLYCLIQSAQMLFGLYKLIYGGQTRTAAVSGAAPRAKRD